MIDGSNAAFRTRRCGQIFGGEDAMAVETPKDESAFSAREPAKPWPATFAEAFDPRNNSFGFLRFFLAVAVVFSHCFRFGRLGVHSIDGYSGSDIGGLAVSAFFVISGFLITRSYQRTDSLGRFLWHRALRILPGFWVCLVVVAFVLGPLAWRLEYGHLSGYFTTRDGGPMSYVLHNAFVNLRHIWIDGLFLDNPVPTVVNGSLWSLAFEMKCYIGVAALGWFGLSRSRIAIAVLFVALWGAFVIDSTTPWMESSIFWKLVGKLTVQTAMYFAAGAMYLVFSDVVPFRRSGLCIACATLLVGIHARSFDCVAPLALPYVLLWAACRLPLQGFDRKADYSYGIYIYSTPVQQILVLVGADRWGLAPLFALSLIGTAPLAYLSFRCVEEPCLRLKNWSWRGAGRIAAATQRSAA
jgi:peptidoglycan/LPS O-acetylase OafA/YrhL